MFIHGYTMYIHNGYTMYILGYTWYIHCNGYTWDIPCIYHTYTIDMDEDTICIAYTRHIPKYWVPDGVCRDGMAPAQRLRLTAAGGPRPPPCQAPPGAAGATDPAGPAVSWPVTLALCHGPVSQTGVTDRSCT